MKIAKVKGYPQNTLKLPTRGTPGSAGLDFFCPMSSSWFRSRLFELNNGVNNYKITNEGIVLQPHERVIIPSGFKVKVPEGCSFIAFERSGMAGKKGIVPTARVVDSDFQGELCIGVLNTTNKEFRIPFGEKITQFVLLPVIIEQNELVNEDELFTKKSERGEGGFGSTGDR